MGEIFPREALADRCAQLELDDDSLWPYPAEAELVVVDRAMTYYPSCCGDSDD